MKIAVRMDDIAPGMDRDKFYRFYRMLAEKGIRPLLGVVPCNRDDNLNVGEIKADSDFWQEIRRLKADGCTIAMHGFDHIYTTTKGGIFPLNRYSEFAGVEFEEQKRQLKQGKRILEENGIETDIFMAPAHSYDVNTLRALAECGFRSLTDGFGIKPYSYKQLLFYPISFKQSISLKRKKGTTTFVVHSNTMTEQDFKTWDNMLNKSDCAEWIDYSGLLETEPVKRNAFGSLFEKVLAISKHILVRL